MNNIVLQSRVLVVTKIVRKTSAKMFKNLDVGDEIQLSTIAKGSGSGRGCYAQYIQVRNIKTGEYTSKSFNELDRLLDAFEFEYRMVKKDG